MKKALLLRTYLKDRTIGDLYPLDSVFSSEAFKTLERAWKNNVVGESCIPEGSYIVKRDHAGRFQYYAVQNVAGRTFIEFHGGVYPSHSEGCILVGNERTKENNLSGSELALNRLIEVFGEGSFMLTIRERNAMSDGLPE